MNEPARPSVPPRAAAARLVAVTIGDYAALGTNTVELTIAPRRTIRYACPKDHEFEVPFSDDAEVPAVWECRLHGTASKLIDGTEPEAKKVKPPRTHWDMLLERRTIPELEDLLDERLQELKVRRSRTA